MEPSEVQRAASYIAAKERLDAGRRKGKVSCKAPNRLCGNRCIPPEWDCRLKGEGDDGHLKAVGKGSDVVGGLANIERGISRVQKGATSLSFSEIEGGRRAIARGVAKLSPGDLKSKQEVRANTEKFINYVLTPMSAVVGAALIHKGLKNFGAYRNGPGAQVDAAALGVFTSIRRNIPIYGQGVRQREQVGIEAVSALGRAGEAFNSRGPEARPNLNRMAAGGQREGLPIQARVLLDKSLNSVDQKPGSRSSAPAGTSYDEWERNSQSAFWSTKRTQALTPTGGAEDGSIFSVQATNQLFANSFGLPRPANRDLRAEGNEIIGQVSEVFKKTGEGIRTSMKQAGLDPTNADTVREYIRKASEQGDESAPRLRTSGTSLDTRSADLLVTAVTNKDYPTQAKNFYRQTLGGYDELFKRVASDANEPPSISRGLRGDPAEQDRIREARRSSYYNEASLAQSQYLANRVELPAAVYGTYTGQIAKQTYYARNVAGPKRLNSSAGVTLNLSATQALNAGVEIARATGLPEPANARDALRLVTQTYGSDQAQYQGSSPIGRINLTGGGNTTTWTRSGFVTATNNRPAQPASTGAARTARRRTRSRSQIIADLLKQKGTNYTPEGAAAEADRIIGARGDEEELLPIRVMAYLSTRAQHQLPGMG